MFKSMRKLGGELRQAGSKAGKVLTVAATAGVIGASNAQAAITYADGTGFTGDIDTVPFTSAAVIAVVFVGVLVSVGAGFAMIKRAR